MPRIEVVSKWAKLPRVVQGARLYDVLAYHNGRWWVVVQWVDVHMAA